MNENAQPVAASAEAPAAKPEPQLPVLRFSLRNMFWLVTFVCLVLAWLVAVWGLGSAPLAVLLGVLVIALHAAGTAIGTRLRQHADEHQAWESAQFGVVAAPSIPALSPPLLHKHGFQIPWLKTIVAAGILGGGTAGAALLVSAVGQRATLVGIAVGALSTAILGGWFAFLAVSFWAILRQGWRDTFGSDRHAP